MKPISGGVTKVTSCNSYVNYPGKKHRGMSAKHMGTSNGGKDLGRDATNVIPGTKRSNKVLSPSANAASYTNEDTAEGGGDIG